MDDTLTTDRFEVVWDRIPNRDQLATLDTLATAAFKQPYKPKTSSMPKVAELVELDDLIGEGGNGQVFSARQAPTGRVVAVKRPVDLERDDMKQGLLREATVIGYLEHSSIPPVHFVGLGDSDELLVGMKRVQGATLAPALEGPDLLEHLDENIDILIQVCSAIGFAHAQGIAHLDLKPANIMAGQFGEVYVLDWGLALAVRDDVPKNIPRPQKDRLPRGTPAFIAPETIIGETPTPATDVYQLGGILYMMLTGEPPNAGSDAFEAMRAAYEGRERRYPEAVPAALTAICRRALSREPADRYENAELLREALVDFRRRRSALEAVEAAEKGLERLSKAMDDELPASLVYQEYGAARQAVNQAMQLQDDTILTRQFLQLVLERMIEWELDRGNHGAADVMLSELPVANDVLEKRCEVLRSQRQSELIELENLRSQIDPGQGVREKALMAFGIGVAVALAQIIPSMAGTGKSPPTVLVSYLAYLCFLGIAAFILREQLFVNIVNRGATLMVWVLSVFGLAARVGAFFELMTVSTAFAYDLGVVALLSLFAGNIFDRRLYPVVPIYIVGSGLLFALPEYPLLVFGVTHFLGLTTAAISIAWGRVET